MVVRSTSSTSSSRPPLTREQELEWRIRQYAPRYMAGIGYNALWLPVLRDKLLKYMALAAAARRREHA